MYQFCNLESGSWLSSSFEESYAGLKCLTVSEVALIMAHPIVWERRYILGTIIEWLKFWSKLVYKCGGTKNNKTIRSCWICYLPFTVRGSLNIIIFCIWERSTMTLWFVSLPVFPRAKPRTSNFASISARLQSNKLTVFFVNITLSIGNSLLM